MRIWMGGLVLAGAAAVLFSACGQDQEETIDIGVVEQRPSGEGGIPFLSKRKRPSAAARGPRNTVLPDNFPGDVPLYEGSEITNVNAVPASGLIMVALNTSDDIEHAVNFYNNSPIENGWQQKNFMMPGGTAMMSFEKEGGRTLSLLIRAGDVGTNIYLTLRDPGSISR